MKVNGTTNVLKMTIAEGINPYHDMNIILTPYQIICYPYLGIVLYDIIRIPCDCI